MKSRNFCIIGSILIIFDFLPNSLICIFPQSYLFSGKVPGTFRKSWIRFSQFLKGSDFGVLTEMIDIQKSNFLEYPAFLSLQNWICFFLCDSKPAHRFWALRSTGSVFVGSTLCQTYEWFHLQPGPPKTHAARTPRRGPRSRPAMRLAGSAGPGVERAGRPREDQPGVWSDGGQLGGPPPHGLTGARFL